MPSFFGESDLLMKDRSGRVAHEKIVGGLEPQKDKRTSVKGIEDLMLQTLRLSDEREQKRIKGPATELAAVANAAIRATAWARIPGKELEGAALRATRALYPSANAIDNRLIAFLSGVIGGVRAVELLHQEGDALRRSGGSRFIGTNDRLDAEQKTDLITVDNLPDGRVTLGLVQVKSFFDTKRDISVEDVYGAHVRVVADLLTPDEYRTLQTESEAYHAALAERTVQQRAIEEALQKERLMQASDTVLLAMAEALTLKRTDALDQVWLVGRVTDQIMRHFPTHASAGLVSEVIGAVRQSIEISDVGVRGLSDADYKRIITQAVATLQARNAQKKEVPTPVSPRLIHVPSTKLVRSGHLTASSRTLVFVQGDYKSQLSTGPKPIVFSSQA